MTTTKKSLTNEHNTIVDNVDIDDNVNDQGALFAIDGQKTKEETSGNRR